MHTENYKSTDYLDILRWFAASIVVLHHVASGIVDTVPEQMMAMELNIYGMIKNITTVGVPIFLMISGSLMLDPKKEIGIERTLKHYVPRILVVLFLFGVPFAVMELIVNEGGFSPMMLVEGFFLTLAGNTWAHMWYLYELAGIYLLTPFLKEIIKGGKRFLEYGLALGFLFFSLFPMIERVFGIHVGIVYQLTGIYLFYYMFGYYLHLYGTIDWRLCAGLLVILESVICISGIIGLHIEIQYNFLIVVATSASLFLMLRNIKKASCIL